MRPVFPIRHPGPIVNSNSLLGELIQSVRTANLTQKAYPPQQMQEAPPVVLDDKLGIQCAAP